MGSPFVGREEDGIERYHFVHRGWIVTRSCTKTRDGGETGKVGEGWVKLWVVYYKGWERTSNGKSGRK